MKSKHFPFHDVTNNPSPSDGEVERVTKRIKRAQEQAVVKQAVEDLLKQRAANSGKKAHGDMERIIQN